MSFVVTNFIFDLLASASPSPSPSASPADVVSKIRGEYGIPETLTWLIVVVVVFGAIVIVLKNTKDLLESSEKLHGYWQKFVTFFQGDPTQQSAEIRIKLLKRLRQDIDRRIATSLINQIWMDVQAQDQAEAIDSPLLREPLNKPAEIPQRTNFFTQISRLFKLGDQPEEKLDVNQPISEMFDLSNGRLLILGDPGSGKTTELLRLAKQLIEQAEEDETKLIPVVFELSAWKDDHQSIGEWLVAQLKETYNVPKAIGQQWLQNRQLIPLLDGLDELAVRRGNEVDRSRQILCAAAINDFALGDTQQKLTICCRQKDYDEGFEQGRVKLDKLKGAVYLQPLGDTQIEKYFNDLKRPQIWQHIQQQSELKEMTRAPLFLSMMVLACQGRRITNQKELFNAYIEEQFNKRLDEFREKERPKYPNSGHPYERTQATHYLTVLATKLKAEAKTEFLIEKMQPNWLESKPQKWIYQFMTGLIFGLILGLFWGLISDLIGELTSGPIFGLALGLSSGLVFGVISGINIGLNSELDYIATVEAFQFFMPGEARRETFRAMARGLISALILGLIIGLILEPIAGLIFGSITGLIFGLIIGPIVGLSTDIQVRSKPNQGIYDSVKNSVIIVVIYSLLFVTGHGFLSQLFHQILSQDKTALLIFLLLGLLLITSVWSSGGLASIQHVALRLVLWQNKLIPWNYAKFLDYASDLRVIQRIGGRYRFVHDLLREHFAAMEE